MRKIYFALVLSICLFLTGTGIFIFEISQIQPQQVDLSNELKTITIESDEEINIYTKTYLYEGIGDVKIEVDSMQEDDTLAAQQIIVTYPKHLAFVREHNNIDFQNKQTDTNQMQRIFKIFRDKSYKEFIAKNGKIHIKIRYGKGLKNKIKLVDSYY